MVGPRSKGCRKCVDRKVKCDETRPGCDRCAKGHFKCPGYGPVFQFYDTFVLGSEAITQKANFEDLLSKEDSSQRPISTSPSRQARRPGTKGQRSQSLAVATQPRNPQPLLQSISTKSTRNAELAATFINGLPQRLWYTRNWFAGICQADDDPTLKRATRALIKANGALVYKDDSLVQQSRHEYGDALRSLKDSIAHPRQSRVGALQNTILVLSIFELYDVCLARHSTDLTLEGVVKRRDKALWLKPSIWMHHAQGIQQIMRSQPPESYNHTDLNRFLYISMRDTFILLAYKDQTSCFLEEPAWLSIIYSQTEPHTLEHALCALFAVQVQGPGLVRDASTAMRTGGDISTVREKAVSLHREACHAFHYFMSELAQISRLPSEVPSGDPGAVPNSIYSFRGVRFPDVLTPRAICNHHSLIIHINRVLGQLQSQDGRALAAGVTSALEVESAASAVEICKCLPMLERMPVTMLGVFSLAYPIFYIDCALEACPADYLDWIMDRKRRWVTENE
ncbi:hypothetical protein PV11_08856 [Exophiala sideris]|uniref:Zn(2)-C6 fungal-type domain-containing protein n=1 Tax=Exophiala sideris TaxID=1016849 RepID=A0A0D1WPN2_9EURO|nr:hypothetical protein PV11_08856 [Exophiala sideris]